MMLDAVVLVALAAVLAFGFYALGRSHARTVDATRGPVRSSGNRIFYVLGTLGVLSAVGLVFAGALAASVLASLMAVGMLAHPRVRAEWYALGYDAGWIDHDKISGNGNLGGVLHALHLLNRQMVATSRAVDAFVEEASAADG